MEHYSIAELQKWFPNLDPVADRVTSPATDAYNCVAWANQDTSRTWESPPARRSPSYWPEGVEGQSPAGWIALFRRAGFSDAPASRELEPGIEKVAIYVSRDWSEANHVARQLPNGAWTSKLGFLEDIEHRTLEALEGEMYGIVGIILQRPATG